MWTEEDSVSVVHISKISSPAPEHIKAGCNCTVKGFEDCPSWVVSLGSQKEVKEMEKEFVKGKEATAPTKRGREDGTDASPPAKKPRRFFKTSEWCFLCIKYMWSKLL